ncbi:hypothetical protein BJY00DRAFT_308920 [Aspergillus carlsbadensis]|nr:hypothetical protein BJY00DRAFT_308920 [Aspergillus carlsbadensis]
MPRSSDESGLALPSSSGGVQSGTPAEDMAVGSSRLTVPVPPAGSQSTTPAANAAVEPPTPLENTQENAFRDCNIAICGHHEPLTTVYLKTVVIGLGAAYSRIVRTGTTHLIATEREIHDMAKQVARARTVPTCEVVSLGWLLDSRTAGRPLAANGYRLAMPAPLAAGHQAGGGEAGGTPGGRKRSALTFRGETPRRADTGGDEGTPERPKKQRRIALANAEEQEGVQTQAVAAAGGAQLAPVPVPDQTQAQAQTQTQAQAQAAIRTPHTFQMERQQAAMDRFIATRQHQPAWPAHPAQQPIQTYNQYAAANQMAGRAQQEQQAHNLVDERDPVWLRSYQGMYLQNAGANASPFRLPPQPMRNVNNPANANPVPTPAQNPQAGLNQGGQRQQQELSHGYGQANPTQMPMPPQPMQNVNNTANATRVPLTAQNMLAELNQIGQGQDQQQQVRNQHNRPRLADAVEAANQIPGLRGNRDLEGRFYMWWFGLNGGQ